MWMFNILQDIFYIKCSKCSFVLSKMAVFCKEIPTRPLLFSCSLQIAHGQWRHVTITTHHLLLVTLILLHWRMCFLASSHTFHYVILWINTPLIIIIYTCSIHIPIIFVNRSKLGSEIIRFLMHYGAIPTVKYFSPRPCLHHDTVIIMFHATLHGCMSTYVPRATEHLESCNKIPDVTQSNIYNLVDKIYLWAAQIGSKVKNWHLLFYFVGFFQ